MRSRRPHKQHLLLLLLASSIACKGENAADSRAKGKAKAIIASSEQDSEPASASESGIADRRLHKFAGQMDTQNHYVSTVMVTLSDPEGEADCSGVLLNPRVVLTAAHCVCAPQKVTTTTGTPATALSSSSCARRAFITTVHYGATQIQKYKEETTEKRYSHHQGTVHPHPEFQLRVDEKGTIVSERANLATILLDEPVDGDLASAIFPESEAQLGEFLVMAGYASKNEDDVGGTYGVRYFRQNKVTQAPASTSGRVIYEQQGPYLYNGYPGGPCYREAGSRRWLIGIASTGSARELSCTSTYFFRNWLLAELQSGTNSPPPNDSGDAGTRR